MKNKKSLNDKILRSVYTYETRKFAFDSFAKGIVLVISLIIILVFGGVLYDLFVESEMGELFKENSFSRMGEISSVIFTEMPTWLIGMYVSGLILGCIIIGIAIKNRKRIFHKAVSIFRYWLHI